MVSPLRFWLPDLNRETRKSGRHVATASDDSFLYVWNEASQRHVALETRACCARMLAHQAQGDQHVPKVPFNAFEVVHDPFRYQQAGSGKRRQGRKVRFRHDIVEGV